MNKGYINCDKTIKGDETYTPYYAVEPLLPKDLILEEIKVYQRHLL